VDPRRQPTTRARPQHEQIVRLLGGRGENLVGPARVDDNPYLGVAGHATHRLSERGRDLAGYGHHGVYPGLGRPLVRLNPNRAYDHEGRPTVGRLLDGVAQCLVSSWCRGEPHDHATVHDMPPILV
jgi:hypothetical protein